MNKFLYSMSILALLFLVLGSFLFPSDMIMWFASTSVADNIIRIALVGMLVVLLFSVPPRSIYTRIILGFAAVALAGWTVYGFSLYDLKLLDGLLYAQLCIVFSLAATEISYTYSETTDTPRFHSPEPHSA